MKKGSVTVGYCHPEQVSGMFCMSLTTLLLRDGRKNQRVTRYGDIINIQSSPRIASARNQIVEQFLRGTSEWLFMVDADMTFGPDAIDRLVDSAVDVDAKIMGGLAFILSKSTGKVEPTIRVFTGDDLHTMEPVWQFPSKSIVKVDATGCACVLIHRDVFDAMELAFASSQYPWFAETEKDGVEFGEDVTFFLRAAQLHFPLYVNTGVEFGHMKSVPIGLDDYITYRQTLRHDGDEAALAARTRQNLKV